MANGNQQYDDEMRGVLFKNKDKTPGDKRPDYKGRVQVGGNKLWLSAWLRTSAKTGEKFMSLALEVPQQGQSGGAPAPTAAAPVTAAPVVPPAEDPEDIPF
jgi:uncharacterized protein (DUF736 family)